MQSADATSLPSHSHRKEDEKEEAITIAVFNFLFSIFNAF